MTITFENENDVIIYALEKTISYARTTQQIFVAQCVWWLASIIGLEQGLIVHIDNQRKGAEVVSQEVSQPEVVKENSNIIRQLERTVSLTTRDIQEDPRSRPQ
jgi:hypothetical protein